MASAKKDIFSCSKEELIQELFDRMEQIIYLQNLNTPQNRRPNEVMRLGPDLYSDMAVDSMASTLVDSGVCSGHQHRHCEEKFTRLKNTIAELEEKIRKLETPSTQMSGIRHNPERGACSKIEEEKNSQLNLETPSTQMSGILQNPERGAGSKTGEEKNSQLGSVHQCKKCTLKFKDEQKLAEHEKSHDI